jgi:hypothetical protein
MNCGPPARSPRYQPRTWQSGGAAMLLPQPATSADMAATAETGPRTIVRRGLRVLSRGGGLCAGNPAPGVLHRPAGLAGGALPRSAFTLASGAQPTAHACAPWTDRRRPRRCPTPTPTSQPPPWAGRAHAGVSPGAPGQGARLRQLAPSYPTAGDPTGPPAHPVRHAPRLPDQRSECMRPTD